MFARSFIHQTLSKSRSSKHLDPANLAGLQARGTSGREDRGRRADEGESGGERDAKGRLECSRSLAEAEEGRVKEVKDDWTFHFPSNVLGKVSRMDGSVKKS